MLIFGSTSEELRAAYERAMARSLMLSIFSEAPFNTGHDAANREAIQAVSSDQFVLTGLALRAERKQVDADVKDLTLHQ